MYIYADMVHQERLSWVCFLLMELRFNVGDSISLDQV